MYAVSLEIKRLEDQCLTEAIENSLSEPLLYNEEQIIQRVEGNVACPLFLSQYKKWIYLHEDHVNTFLAEIIGLVLIIFMGRTDCRTARLLRTGLSLFVLLRSGRTTDAGILSGCFGCAPCRLSIQPDPLGLK